MENDSGYSLPSWIDLSKAYGSEVERRRLYHAIIEANLPYMTDSKAIDKLHRDVAEMLKL